MTDIIYKFLDNYVGNKFILKSTLDNEFHTLYYDDSSIILSFRVNYWKKVTVFGFSGLCKTVSNHFSIEKEEAKKHIEQWFLKKHNLEKIEDVLKK